ncbi:hypothetical protein PIB30_032747 [Stylosanthes scabra]|uniref:Uncharacterized protein n=1 Tax=Stylosanthes scabra TaxID=79078 RepID=A0ABU6TC01_9FABA|nr:hypothetical protein [Stylosanthes scabra]
MAVTMPTMTKQHVLTYFYLLVYISLSSGWLLSTLYFNFPFPITLTMIHMAFSGSVAFLLIRVLKICYLCGPYKRLLCSKSVVNEVRISQPPPQNIKDESAKEHLLLSEKKVHDNLNSNEGRSWNDSVSDNNFDEESPIMSYARISYPQFGRKPA